MNCILVEPLENLECGGLTPLSYPGNLTSDSNIRLPHWLYQPPLTKAASSRRTPKSLSWRKQFHELFGGNGSYASKLQVLFHVFAPAHADQRGRDSRGRANKLYC